MARSSHRLLITLVTLVICCVGIGYLFSSSNGDSPFSYADETRGIGTHRADLARINDLSSAFREVARVMKPSVVSIHSVRNIRPTVGQPNRSRPDIPDEFRRFFEDDTFGRFFFEPNVPSDGFEQRGLGTGVIVSSDGLIVTNNHVVREADEINVRLSNGRSFAAQVQGTDAKTDLALLKIDATGLHPARLGDSDDVTVGDWVLAIGSPFELEQTVTAGIISAKGRANVGILGSDGYEDFIQTDAAINPGNSGGPLVNMQGQVVGINTAIASRTGGYMGIGFAIPSNMVRMVKDAIVQHGHVERGRLGALIQDLNEVMAEYLGYNSNHGVLIGDILPESPAEQAGLSSGDIVMAFNGRAVESASQLRNAVAATPPGTSADLVVFRDGKKRTFRVVVGQLDEQSHIVSKTAKADSTVSLGMTVVTLTTELANRLGYGPQEQGVAVTDVEPGSLAARGGIRQNDVIVAVGRTPVATVSQFRVAMDEHDLERGFPLQVKRDGVRRYVFLKSRN